jgi:hypothetical protein
VTTEDQSTLLRVEGDVLLDILQTAPSVHSALTRASSQRRGTVPPTGRGALVDDPVWAQA